MSTNKTKRSSLKNNSNLTPEEIEKIKAKSKRLSVKWNSSANLTYLDLSQKKVTHDKVSFDSEKNKKFLENRRQSVKNEFTLVKEMLKNTDIQNELDEITKKNTKLNEKHDTSPGTDSSESSNEEE